MPGPISTNEISSDLQAGPLASLCSVATARTLIPLALPDTYLGGAERKRGMTPSAEPSAGIQPGSHYKLSHRLLAFFFFKNNTVYSWHFLCGWYITMAMFYLVSFSKKAGGRGECHQSLGLPDEKVNQWVKSQCGSGKKTTLSPCSGIVLTGKKWGKLRKAGFSQSSHFKVYLFDSFISQTQCKFKANTKCFQTPLPCFNYPLWTCYRASYWSYGQKKEDSPQRPHFCNAEEINSKGRVKESADLKTGRGWDCSHCRAANPLQKPSNHPSGQDADSGHPSANHDPENNAGLEKIKN